jgi:hypothetical protein
VAWPNGVEPEPTVPHGVKRVPYDEEVAPHVFDRLNALVSREPFDIHVAKIYALEATAQALKDVKEHHLGKLAIKIR